MNRLTGYKPVGSVEVGPQDREVLVGSFNLNAGDDTIWVKVKQLNPPDVWSYSYGLLTWRSDKGQELGTIKVYGDVDAEVFRLTVGLPPQSLEGSLYFTARAYNRRWIAVDKPPIWSLSFEAQSGVTTGGGGGEFGFPATLGVLADLADTGVSYAIGANDFATVKLSPL